MKKKTGRVLPTEDYRDVDYCLRCGYIGGEKLCEKCKDLKHCECCGIMLREEYEYFYYKVVRLPANKWVFIEWSQMREPHSKPFDEKICKTCVDWRDDIQNRCQYCFKPFQNSPDNYRRQGNVCTPCNHAIRVRVLSESKTRIYKKKKLN